MSNEMKLAKELQKAEQEIGVLKHKLKQRKDDKNEFNAQITKLKKENTSLRSDLKLAYENLEEKSQAVITLKKAFQIIELPKEDKP